MSSNPLPPLSSLTAKPPQNPSGTSSTMTIQNYAIALAASQQNQREDPAAKPSNIDTGAEGKENASATASSGSSVGEGVISPTSAGWRPNLDRQQSWSEQDRKRMMQSSLMSPKADGEEGAVGSGFSTKG